MKKGVERDIARLKAKKAAQLAQNGPSHLPEN
jgi:hypothetical protein